MESDLARLADLVIIIVESPGTFAELGAFSLSDELRQKIYDRARNPESHQSLYTGPYGGSIRICFCSTIYVLYLEYFRYRSIEEGISRIPKADPVRISDLSSSPKHCILHL